jgi:FixJ family two-component response regulator
MSHPVRPVVTIHDEREAMRHARGRVSVVDDDDAVRSAVAAVLSDQGYAVAQFASAAEFIDFEQRAEPLFPGPACLLLDVKMPDMSGLELQQRLASIAGTMPIVFMSGGSSAAEAVQALKGGALDFLVKPFDDEELIAAVLRALARSAELEESSRSAQEIERRFAELSAREVQIAKMVSAGLRNQQIADELGIAERTVKLHRMHMMRKLGAANLIDLVRLLDTLS